MSWTASLASLSMLLFPMAGYALGLGKLQVDSNLGQPLRLQIELESVTAVEAETLDVSLATRSDFARAGVEYPEVANLLNFELVADPDGRYRVLITTEDAIQEAYLHFLVSALWTGGKAVREYTALLDPPLYTGNPATGITLTGENVAEEIDAAVTAAEEAEAASRSAGGAVPASGSILVQRGDTLSQLVDNIAKPSDVDHFQALEAIYRKNPQAFIENNMNLLRTGATLQVPSFEEMQNTSRRESLASFAAQLEKFNEYRNAVRQKTEQQSSDALNNLIAEAEQEQGVVEDSAPPVTPEDLGAAQEAPTETEQSETAAAEETLAVEQEPLEEEVIEAEDPKLTIGQQVIDGGSVEGQESEQQLETLRSQLAQLDESLLASGVENESVRDNLQQIQDQVDRLSTLIEIEDTNLAQAQNRAAGAESGDEQETVGPSDVGEVVDEVSDPTVVETLEQATDDAAQDAATQEAVEDILAGTGSAEEALTGAESGAEEPMAADVGEGEGFTSVDAAVDPEASVEQELSNESEEVATVDNGETVSEPAASVTTGQEVSEVATEDGTAGQTTEDDEQQAAELLAAQSVSGDGETVDGGESDTASRGSSRKVASGGFLDSILDSVKGLVGPLAEHGLKIALGLLALIAGLFLWQRRKSQKEYDASMLDIETEEVSMNSEASIQRVSEGSGIDLASANDSALELTIGGGMSYLSEEGIAGVNEEDNEVIKAGAVDPLAEADVYLAYDRDEQAIQVLKEAFADAPERGELAEKLLEIYHKQDDRRSFDTLAAEMHRRIDATHNFSWDKVVAMGREVSPENTLYEGDGPPPKTDSAETAEPSVLELDQELIKEIEGASDAKEMSEPPLSERTETPSDEVSKIDLDELNMVDDASENSAVRGLEVDDLDFDIEQEISKGDQSSALDAPTLSQIISENVDSKLSLKETDQDDADSGDEDDVEVDDISLGGDDLQLELADDTSPIDLTDEKSDKVASSEKSDIEDLLQDDDDEVAIDAHSGMSEMSEASMNKLEPYHESETALELAKAYLELGEQEIAKGFIEEVLTEGSDKQKTKARKLIKELAS